MRALLSAPRTYSLMSNRLYIYQKIKPLWLQPSKKKSKRVYGLLIDKVCEEWNVVKEKCHQATKFESDVKGIIEDIIISENN